MDAMSGVFTAMAWILALVMLVALFAAAAALSLGTLRRVVDSHLIRPTAEGYRLRTQFFTRSEAAFYAGIRPKLPPGHHVFPKVRLSDLLDIPGDGRQYWQAYGGVSQKHVDFVLCDAQFRPYLVVELDGKSHARPRQQRADATKDAVLEAAGIELLRLRIGEQWDFSKIASRLQSAHRRGDTRAHDPARLPAG